MPAVFGTCTNRMRGSGLACTEVSFGGGEATWGSRVRGAEARQHLGERGDEPAAAVAEVERLVGGELLAAEVERVRRAEKLGGEGAVRFAEALDDALPLGRREQAGARAARRARLQDAEQARAPFVGKLERVEARKEMHRLEVQRRVALRGAEAQ